MSVIGRICSQFQTLVRLTNQTLPAFQPEMCLAWDQTKRFYTRKSNIARRAKKAAERALKKEFKVTRTTKLARPYPLDPCADKEPSVDNVWFQHLHPFKQLTFVDAINFHRETLHETVLNNPSAFVNVVVVLNLKTKKQGVNLDKIRGSFMPPHLFPAGKDIRILTLCKEPEDVKKALEAGSFSAGGLEMIKSIEEGNLQVEEYDTVVAHHDVLAYLSPIRGLLKTKFPRSNLGTLGRDVASMITKVKESRSYNLINDSADNSVGWVDDIIGRFDMPLEHLEDNFRVFLSQIIRQQPRGPDTPFIRSFFVKSPATDEVFQLDRLTVIREEIRDLGSDKKEIVQELIIEEGEPKPSAEDTLEKISESVEN